MRQAAMLRDGCGEIGNSPMELNGKFCLITGGTKGVGAAVAVERARRGAPMPIVGRVAEAVATLVCNNLITGGNLAIDGGMKMRIA